MKLFIVYTKNRQVTVQNVNYISFFHNTLYYFVGDDPSVCIVDLKDVVLFKIIE